MKQKLFIAAGIVAFALIVFGLATVQAPNQSLSASVSQDVFYASGTTNASSTVNTTSTQVIAAGWALYARISNTGTSTLSCYLDGDTAASSSVASNAGVIIQSNASAGNSACFGYAAGCIPYVGAVNCVASVKTTVGVITH